MGLGLRHRASGITSAALAIVISLLPYVPPQFELVRAIVVAILSIDAVIKVFDVQSLREFFSALYSLALATSFLTFFHILGTPFSEFFAIFLIIDALYKFRVFKEQLQLGVVTFDTRTRHIISAFVTLILGLSVLFGLDLPLHLNIVLGLAILFDSVMKLEYIGVL